MGFVKKMRMLGISIIMLAALSACGEHQDYVFSLCGQELYEQDVRIWGMMFAKDYNIKDTEQLRQEYENGITYGEYYKGQLEEEIVDSVLLYKEAEKNGFQAEESADGKAKAEQFWEYYGDRRLSERDVKRETVEKYYRMKMTGEAYLESLTQEPEEEKTQQYLKVMEITFPTVEVDEDGMVKSGADGKALHISDEELQIKLAEAQNFCEMAKAGEDLDELMARFGQSAVKTEKYLSYSELDGTYKKIIDSLKDGEISEVASSDYGYFVVKLLDKNATDYARTLSEYQGQRQDDAVREEALKDLRSKYIHGQDAYRNDKEWKKISFDMFVR